MADQPLVVDPGKIAGKLGITAPSPQQLEKIADAILDCQADVEAFLNRPLFAQAATMSAAVQDATYDVTDWRAWPEARVYDDRIEVVSATANGDGTWTVQLKVGLDGPNDRRVVRYVSAHAVQSILNDANSGMGKRQVTSVSAEGQSISYAQGSVADGAAGALPNIKTLAALKRRAVHRTDRGRVSIWPLTGVGYSDGR